MQQKTGCTHYYIKITLRYIKLKFITVIINTFGRFFDLSGGFIGVLNSSSKVSSIISLSSIIYYSLHSNKNVVVSLSLQNQNVVYKLFLIE